MTDWQTPWAIIGWILLSVLVAKGLFMLLGLLGLAWESITESWSSHLLRRAHKGKTKCGKCGAQATRYLGYVGSYDFYCDEHRPNYIGVHWLEWSRQKAIKERDAQR